MQVKNKVGEIILIPFPFTDLSDYKVRPSLVFALNDKDCVLMFISSIKPKDKHFIVLNPDSQNNLKEVSYIRYMKIVTLESVLSVGTLGKISSDIFGAVKEKLKEVLDL
jgi:mRNA interferase MazF